MYLIVDYRSYFVFPIAQEILPWQPIVTSKLAKSAYSSLFVALASGNKLQYRHSDFRRFIRDDMAILCANLVNLGPVTLEFKRVVGMHPSFLKINHLIKIISGST